MNPLVLQSGSNMALVRTVLNMGNIGQYYGWPKWTKSAKGSMYEKFHVRQHTRIKSFVYKTIHVSRVSCIK